MKTLKDLFELFGKAAEQNNHIEGYNHWFIDYSGHTNEVCIRFYSCGWKLEERPDERLRQTLDEEGIQAVYYWLKTRLH